MLSEGVDLLPLSLLGFDAHCCADWRLVTFLMTVLVEMARRRIEAGGEKAFVQVLLCFV